MSGVSSLIRPAPSRIGRLPNTRFSAPSTLSWSPSCCARAGRGAVRTPLAAATPIAPSVSSIRRRVTVGDDRMAVLLYTRSAAERVGGGIRLERPGQPERATEVARSRRGPREPEPLAVDLEGPVGVDDDVPVAIVRARLRDRHLLVPTVLAAHGIGLHREGQVLVDARVLPPDPRGVGIVARERSHALELAHPPLPALDLLELDERGGPPLATRRAMKPPAPQVVRARDHTRVNRLRHPGAIDEVTDRRRDRIHAGAVELAGRERLLVGAVDLILDEERAVFPHIGERRQPLARRRVGEAGDAPLEDPAVDLLDPELLARAIGRLEVLPHAEAPVGINPPRELDPELVLLPHLPESGRLVGLPGEVEGPALPLEHHAH